MWTSTGEGDLASIWNVLETEAADDSSAISVVDSGLTVRAGRVKLGVDPEGCRHVLIPLLPGEAFAPDTTGRSVHLRRVSNRNIEYLSAVCLHGELHKVFAQFTLELFSEIGNATSPARATVETLARWRLLFADAASAGELSENQVIGLLAELLVLEEILGHDPNRDVGVWTGPQAAGSEHDFRRDSVALEVKATQRREGRIVGISSVDQLDPPPGGSLHLVHFRFEPDPSGLSLPEVVERVRQLCPVLNEFDYRIGASGYHERHSEHYERLRFAIVDRRTYDINDPAFPRIVPGSFSGGAVPPGTLRISYSIDLTNEPPVPISEVEHHRLMTTMREP